MQIILRDNQTQVLEKIARRSKMDAWFEIKDSKVKIADIRTLLIMLHRMTSKPSHLMNWLHLLT